ncbi:GNAT family N-acetyltransferase [Massilia antarctica]|uniref:GNAT family N-acetyltransferase n=1 Tax=Massilia antarctica TaxID=2765360 RepID=A0AA49A8I4_9BURK|nr:GNAT family N-acetyltransferase [Massilia antarctica]QPI50176.1 GNAT family N-acetyltransferase [Massilia antarctica]
MSGQALFAAFKQAAGAGSDLVIPVGQPVEAVLRPIATASDRINLDDARLLSEWRNRFVTSFLTEFDSHETRTANWLATAVARDPGKILFMVDTLDGRSVGHVGLGFIDWDKGYVEADAIVRGGDCRKGLMTLALQALLHWARAGLGLPDAWVRVRSDNPAVAFYEKAGFGEVKRVPLASSSADGQITWVEDPAAGSNAPALVYMRYQAAE